MAEAAIARGAPPSMARRVRRIRVCAVLLLLVAWELLARSGLFYEGVVPPLWRIAAGLATEVLSAEFYRHLLVTLIETVVGFAGGALLAVAVAVPLGLNPLLRRAFEPYLVAVGGMPKIIFLPILFLVFGLGIESKMAKGALSAFFPVVFSVMSGIVQISPVHIRVGKSFCLSRRQMLTRIYVPAALNPMLVGARLGFAMALVGILAAEIKYADAGLGYRLMRYADNFQIPSVYAMVILIFGLAIMVNSAITWLQMRYNRHESSTGDARRTYGLGIEAGR